MKFESIGLPGGYLCRLYRGRVPNTRPKSTKGQSGFTLLETIVALTILSITLAVLLQTFSRDLNTVKWADEYVQAQIIANTVFEENTLDRNKPYRPSSDRTGMYDWQINFSPVSEDRLGLLEDSVWQTYNVSVVVRWPPNRSVQLDTIKVGRRATE